jgi:hypothetical protein
VARELAVNLARAWRSLTWKHWAWATAIGILIGISMPLQGFSTNNYWAVWRVLFHTPIFLVFGYAFLLAVALAESSVPAGSTPVAWRYVATLTVASVVCVGILGAFPGVARTPPRHVVAGQLLSMHGTGSPAAQAKERSLAAMTGIGVQAVIHGWLAVFIYVRLRKARNATRALAEAEIGRSEAQRNLLAAQLVAAHAEVDPAFVLRTLAEVERIYEIDVVRGDILLDEFIVYLRDAIPRLRGDEIVGAAP